MGKELRFTAYVSLYSRDGFVVLVVRGWKVTFTF